jgi:electron transfer flavoprotein alpha subunit
MCDAVNVEDGQVMVERSALGGVATAELSLEGSPPICVLAPGAAAETPDLDGVPGVTRYELPASAAAAALNLLTREATPSLVDLAGARRVVSVGRGFSKAEDIELTEELRSLLKAELGCSRPVAEDFKWLPQERLVGLTGTAVTADLYLALGISGQVQHLAGIKGAKVVAAVNNDAKSPITRNADYTIVGDLYKVVPALVEALKSRGNGG